MARNKPRQCGHKTHKPRHTYQPVPYVVLLRHTCQPVPQVVLQLIKEVCQLPQQCRLQ